MPPIFAAALTLALAGPTVAPEASSTTTTTATATTTTTQHRWRFHAELTPLSFYSQTRDRSTTRRLSFGIPGVVAIGFARAVGPYVLVGARLGAELTHNASKSELGSEAQDHRTTWASGSLVPYVEVRPLPKLRVQPFGLVEGGATIFGVRQQTVAGNEAGPARYRSVGALVGGRVGLHAFVLPRLSIDADLGLRRHWAFDWQSPRVPDQGAELPQPLRLTLAATLGLSGWW